MYYVSVSAARMIDVLYEISFLNKLGSDTRYLIYSPPA